MPDLIKLHRMYYFNDDVRFMKIVKITGSGRNAKKETVYDSFINSIPASNTVCALNSCMVISYHVNLKEHKVTIYIA